jgi:hypothetical protein
MIRMLCLMLMAAMLCFCAFAPPDAAAAVRSRSVQRVVQRNVVVPQQVVVRQNFRQEVRQHYAAPIVAAPIIAAPVYAAPILAAPVVAPVQAYSQSYSQQLNSGCSTGLQLRQGVAVPGCSQFFVH